jgi:RNA polymerase sigma factor (sigma-70 family)
LLLPANDAQLLIVGLIASHGEQLRRFLHARVRNISDVPDMLQEVYLRMLRVPNIDSVRSPEAYLFTVAQHVVQQHTLKSAAMPLVELEKVLGTHAHSMHGDPALELIATQSLDRLQETLDELFVQVFREHAYSVHADPELELMATQRLDGLQETFDKLSPKSRAVFMLSRGDGLSLDEIAVQLGVSKPMVKKYLNKALVRFRERLKQDAGPIEPTSIENVLRSWRIG